MTKNRRKKQDARNLVAESGVSYIQALREVDLTPTLRGIPAFLSSLTSCTSGWQPGQLISVGAKPGVGSSVFAISSAVAALRAGRSVLFVTLETSETELRERMVSSMGSILLAELKEQTAEGDNRSAIDRVQTELQSSKFTAVAEGTQTVASIRDRALEAAESEDGLDFIVVSYLQLISAADGSGNRQEAVAQISRDLKSLAVELNVPIMVTVQLNRGSVQLSSIPDSGAIAQDSDVVLLLNREDNQGGGLQFLDVTVAKNRRGASGKVIRCYSQFDRTAIKEVPSKLEELTVWELGEYGGNWFIEGTTDRELAAVALKFWLLDLVPESIEEYDNLFQGGGFRFMPRTDWFWCPMDQHDPESEAELCFIERHGEERRTTELMVGSMIQD